MNSNTNRKQWLAAGMLVGALVLAALATAPMSAFAQTDGGSSDQPVAPAMPWMRGGMHGFGAGGMHAEFQASLAEALGITVDELQAAHFKAHNAMIDKAVDEGTLTQEQADLMKAHHALMQYDAAENVQSFEDALKAAVDAGAITQEQADLLLEQQEQMGRGMLGGDRFGKGGPGSFRGPGGQVDFHHRGLMPGFEGQMQRRVGHMMPGYQAPTATPAANS